MIVLLTDFGQSEYVGVMKGVIYSVHRQGQIVDLCHDIASQNLIEASWVLKNSYSYFPQSTTFCCVVDPGVGTERKALAIKTQHYYFVAPDNGLLSETLKEQKVMSVRQIPIPQDASRTFHGRDVFAKAAARIEMGRFDELGPETNEMKELELYQNGPEGLVVRIDKFGNIVTNIPSRRKSKYTVEIGQRVPAGRGPKAYPMGFHATYDKARDNELFLIEGSNNTLEISLKNGAANDLLNLSSGVQIRIS
jgi:hypothetical protein